MNCHEAEPFLDQLVRLPDVVPEHSALHEHVAGCESCQRAVLSLSQWDRRLSRAMNQVSVPEGLSQRLVAQLQEAQLGQASSSNPHATTKPSLLRKALLRTFVAAAACGVLIAVLFGTRGLMRPSTLSSADVAVLFQQPAHELSTSGASDEPLPRGWSALRREIVSHGWKQVDAGSLSVAPLVTPFEVRVRRSAPVEGALYALPKSNWATTPAETISQAPVQYSPPHVWLVWTEDERVYILMLNGPAPVLEQIQRQMAGNHAVF